MPETIDDLVLQFIAVANPEELLKLNAMYTNVKSMRAILKSSDPMNRIALKIDCDRQERYAVMFMRQIIARGSSS
jgi:hypothetical protein